jgi:7,8-dihydropterin-6-yl-methyl-4-(beta-D-ribofuranosyl)aminobenzene 5'-phosphate synthase
MVLIIVINKRCVTMELKVIFDKSTTNKKLHTGWGISILVDNKILFDTGEKGSWLVNNLNKLGVDIKNDIKNIVISHDHWDHTKGLPLLLKKINNKVPVHICPDFSAKLKKQIVEYGGEVFETVDIEKISENIYVTGAIPAVYKGFVLSEQALFVKSNKGITIITGCSHPGIIQIIDFLKLHITKVSGFLGTKKRL